jgi:Flp pilus assembly protein TadG
VFYRWRQLLRRDRGQEGSVAVEFALILPILLVLLTGIMDFGHYWYLGHVISDASREGARYGTRYKTYFDPTMGTVRTLPKDLSPTISNHVLVTSNYASRLPSTPAPSVTPSGAGYTATDPTTVAGKDLVITVTATKTWWVLGSLIPTLGGSQLLTATTTMTCE